MVPVPEGRARRVSAALEAVHAALGLAQREAEPHGAVGDGAAAAARTRARRAVQHVGRNRDVHESERVAAREGRDEP